MTISVIIPVFNGATSLGRCLGALASSRCSPFECIVVDDGSTDASPSIAQDFAVRMVHSAGGPFGPAHARNRGAELACGDILLFVDADVAVHPDTLDHVANTFARQPSIDATFGCYDDSPAATQFVSQYKNLFHHFVHQHGQEEGSTFWSACGAIRRDVFQASGGFDEAYPSIEDIELGYRLRAAGHAIVLDRAIQVTHLKRWTLRGMIESDLFNRGIPWTRLMLQERKVLNDLNLRTSQRVSALLACLMVVHVVTAPFWLSLTGVRFATRLLAPLLTVTGLIMLLNYRFYAFFQRKRGARFMLAVVPLHLLYYLYSVLAFVIGTGLHLVHARHAPSIEPVRRPAIR